MVDISVFIVKDYRTVYSTVIADQFWGPGNIWIFRLKIIDEFLHRICKSLSVG